MPTRRDVLKTATLATAGAAAVKVFNVPTLDAKKRKVEIKRWRTLGRTGERISDLSMGGGSLGGPKVISRALQIGITYIDTAPDYGRSEKVIGRGWRASGVARDKFHITTKMCRPGGYPGHLSARVSEGRIIRAVEGSLKRLRTDYVDNLFVHAVGERGRNDYKRLMDPEMLNAVHKLKKDGKIRFLGMSTHGPWRPLDALVFAIDSGLYDVVMPAYNFYKWKGLEQVLRYAKQKNVGVMVMKTLRGGKQARRKGVLPKGYFPHAAFKWVWSNDAVAGLIVTMGSISRLERYAQASGHKLASAEHRDLMKMYAATTQETCRIGCGDCMDRCSQNVSIPDVFRYDYYYEDLGDRGHARAKYGELRARGASAENCLTCTKQTCVDACSFGVPIREGLLGVRGKLA